jgi:hypothetical protein
VAERAGWDPIYMSGFGEGESVSYLVDIDLPLEELMAQVQHVFTHAGYDWFYPNDLLLIARKQPEKTDVTVNAEYAGATGMRLVVHLLQGEAADFEAIVAILGRAVHARRDP